MRRTDGSLLTFRTLCWLWHSRSHQSQHLDTQIRGLVLAWRTICCFWGACRTLGWFSHAGFSFDHKDALIWHFDASRCLFSDVHFRDPLSNHWDQSVDLLPTLDAMTKGTCFPICLHRNCPFIYAPLLMVTSHPWFLWNNNLIWKK